jgi:hypothetical protein
VFRPHARPSRGQAAADVIRVRTSRNFEDRNDGEGGRRRRPASGASGRMQGESTT